MRKDSDVEDFEEDEEFEELEDEDDGAGRSAVAAFVVGLLVGGVVGAGVMLFAAPERGSVTRRRVRQRIEDISDDASDELTKQRRRLQKRLKRGFHR